MNNELEEYKKLLEECLAEKGLTFQDFINKCSKEVQKILTKENTLQENISNLKKQLKYCKNPMEKKKLEKQLNELYKERKKKKG